MLKAIILNDSQTITYSTRESMEAENITMTTPYKVVVVDMLAKNKSLFTHPGDIGLR